MVKKSLLSVVAVVLLSTACSRPMATPTPVPTSTPTEAPPTPAVTPAPQLLVIFEPAACPFQLPPGQIEGTTVECGYLVVPENRADPDAGTIRLAVGIFHPPGGATEPDPIIYLAGGPGGSALELLYLSFESAYQPILAAGRDLILFDQRGVGLSEPALDCPDAHELALELLDHELDGEELSQEEMGVLFGDAYAACAEDLRAVADLAAYNTAASAADVNDLRLALGYDQVNLWGQSYGTRLALGVLRHDPQGVRSVVLDSVYPPDVDMYLESPPNLDRALGALFEACAADAACGAAYEVCTFWDERQAADIENEPVARRQELHRRPRVTPQAVCLRSVPGTERREMGVLRATKPPSTPPLSSSSRTEQAGLPGAFEGIMIG